MLKHYFCCHTVSDTCCMHAHHHAEQQLVPGTTLHSLPCACCYHLSCRCSIFNMFDTCMLLSACGYVVFAGPQRLALAYAAFLGFYIPPGENVADFLMDVIAGGGRLSNGPVCSWMQLTSCGCRLDMALHLGSRVLGWHLDGCPCRRAVCARTCCFYQVHGTGLVVCIYAAWMGTVGGSCTHVALYKLHPWNSMIKLQATGAIGDTCSMLTSTTDL
jgi:hypothetical protein